MRSARPSADPPLDRSTVITLPLMCTASTPPWSNTPAGELVDRAVALDRLVLHVALVAHAAQRPVDLEAHDARAVRRLLDDGDRLAHTGPEPSGAGAAYETTIRRHREATAYRRKAWPSRLLRARASPVAHDLGVDRLGRGRLPRLPGVHRDRPRHHVSGRGAVLRHRADAAGRLPAAQAAHPARALRR